MILVIVQQYGVYSSIHPVFNLMGLKIYISLSPMDEIILLCAGGLALSVVEAERSTERNGVVGRVSLAGVALAYSCYGIASTFVSGPLRALYADSTPSGQRSRYFT